VVPANLFFQINAHPQTKVGRCLARAILALIPDQGVAGRGRATMAGAAGKLERRSAAGQARAARGATRTRSRGCRADRSRDAASRW
jgi:hypothetical protein